MKRLFMLIPLALLCCSGCQQSEETVGVDVEADIQAIKDMVAEWNVALNTGDIDKLSFYHADDVIVIPPDGPALIGKEACIRTLQQLLSEVNYNEADVVEDVQVSGDLAVTHFTWESANKLKTGEELPKSSGDGIIVLRKQSDSAWKFIYFIHSDESLLRPHPRE
jgi:uncharacterized protein (TIGR02246 family)